MNGFGERSIISITSPSRRCLSLFSRVTVTRTVSPCRAPLVFDFFTKTSSSSPSAITNIYPSRVICTRPTTCGKTFFSFLPRPLPPALLLFLLAIYLFRLYIPLYHLPLQVSDLPLFFRMTKLEKVVHKLYICRANLKLF